MNGEAHAADGEMVGGLSQDQLLKLSIDFWFQPLTTTKDTFWPIALVVAWISWRDEKIALDRFGRFQNWGRRFWFAPDVGSQIEPFEAERRLLIALQEGIVTAFGITKQDERAPIEKYRWIDLRLFGAEQSDLLENAVASNNGRVVFTDLRIARAEILTVWPTEHPAPGQAPARKPPGPLPSTWRRICADMSELNSEELNKMKGAEMAARFGASETYCRSIRKQVIVDRNG